MLAESSTWGQFRGMTTCSLGWSVRIVAEHRELEKIGLVSTLGARDVDIDMVFGHSNLMDSCGDYLTLLDEKRKKAGKTQSFAWWL